MGDPIYDLVQKEMERRRKGLTMDASELGAIEFIPGTGRVTINENGYVCGRCFKVHDYMTFACLPVEWPAHIQLAGKMMIDTPDDLETVSYDLTRKPEKGGPPLLK